MIIYKTGDLFSSNAQALAHGCSNMGKMGAGIAKTFKEKHFDMFKEYRKLCGDSKFNVGEGYIYKTSDSKYIFNLGTQASLSGATIENVESCFKWMKNQMGILNITHLAMPKIGCGLGRLNWENDVFPIIEDTFGDDDIIVEVWQL